MNLPNLITGFRIVVSPVFFLLALVPSWVGDLEAGVVFVISLWLLFFLMEISDIADGYVARKQGTVSDIGKLLDPFADVVSRLTYFVVFVAIEVMPVWMFLLIMYREVGIIFLRMMMVRMGITLAARGGGKLKTVLYAVSGGMGLLLLSSLYAGWFPSLMPWLPQVTVIVFGFAVFLAWLSFIDYLLLYVRYRRVSDLTDS